MDEMTAYCGLYCGHCYSRTHIAPTARALQAQMRLQGFETFGPYMEDYEAFWRFLTTLNEAEGCPGCRGNGGSPACGMRACAREKGVDACPLCAEYPCDKFHWLDSTPNYPMLKEDNLLMRREGYSAWEAMQCARREQGFTYAEEREKRRTE